MGIIDRIRKFFGRSQAQQNITGVELITERGNSYLMWQGKIYDSDIVKACIRPKVKAVGKLVAKHLRQQEDKWQTNPSNAIKLLLQEPNPWMSGQQLQEKMATQLCLNSNAFALIIRDNMGNPTEVYPIAPRVVEAVYSDAGELLLRFTLTNNKTYTFPYSDVIHIRQDFNENDIFGTPIAPALIPLLDVVATTDQGVINAIRNSSVIRWLLTFSQAMRPDQLQNEAKRFAENFMSTQEGTGVAATDSKYEAKQITPTDYVPNAAQMDRTTARIMQLFNTNEAIITSSFTETQYGSYFDSEIEPVEMQLGFEYTRKLFTRRERAWGNRIVFEAQAWDYASISTKLSLVSLVDRGAMTPNEWRATFNLAPIEGGDTPIRRLDTATVESEDQKEGGSTDAD